jgi:soluble lytic murein transglycosylase-like protein
MTAQDWLPLVKTMCADPEFAAFGFWPESIMAFIEVESGFDQRAERYEPSLRESSYGLMQVLLSTARQMGFPSSAVATDLFVPAINLRMGMRYARWGWDYLMHHLAGKVPTVEEWAAGYNEGYGRALRVPDPAYVEKWLAARARWAGA